MYVQAREGKFIFHRLHWFFSLNLVIFLFSYFIVVVVDHGFIWLFLFSVISVISHYFYFHSSLTHSLILISSMPSGSFYVVERIFRIIEVLRIVGRRSHIPCEFLPIMADHGQSRCLPPPCVLFPTGVYDRFTADIRTRSFRGN